MTGPDPTPDLRAAHRARHMAAAPDALAGFDDDEADRVADGAADRVGDRVAGQDADRVADRNGGPYRANGPATTRLAREPGDPHRTATAVTDPTPVMDVPKVTDPAGALPLVAGPSGGPRHAAGTVRDPGMPGGPDVTGWQGGSGQPDGTGQAPRRPRAGRNLPAAIGVGAALGAAVLASLLLVRAAFYAIILIAVWIGIWELVRAVGTTGLKPPLVPLLLGGTAIAGVAWYGGAEALPYGLLGTVIAVLVWRLADGPENYQRDVVTALLIASYVPFLGGFVVLLLAPGDGHLRVLAMLAGVVLSDTGGYVFGVFFGRRKLAPTVSPSKSWEGFGGSVLTSAVGGALLVGLMLDGRWYWGLVFGVAVAAASTFGDLAESLLKRDLGVKDMGTLLPGHGGLMDRLDSILLAAPVAYAVLTWLVPPG